MIDRLRSSAQRLTRIQSQSARTQRGFTMIELLMVMAVVLIVAAMSIPQWTTYLRSYRIRNSAQMLVAQLAQARMRAVSNFSRVSVFCDSPTSTCKIRARNLGDAGYTDDAPFKVILSPGVTFGAPSAASLGAGASGANNPNTQATTAPILCKAVAFNSRGYPIYDSTVGAGASCLATPSSLADGQLKNNYVIYLQTTTNDYFLAVVVDCGGRGSIWRWSGTQWALIKT